METRAPYALIGFFVLGAVAAVFGFVFWMHNTGGLAERALYRIRFETSVAGVLVGSAVTFNGIKVGEVTDLRVNPENPHQVVATVSVSPTTPVRADTQAGLDIQGLTGIAIISLTGGSPGSPPLKAAAGDIPTLVADPMAWQSVMQAARTALQRVDTVLTENGEPLRNTLANLNTFSEALARNSNRIDGIITGLERMTGGSSLPVRYTYDLTVPQTFPAINKARDKQLVVFDPTSVLMLETRRIIVYPGGDGDASIASAQWSDSLPKLIQSKIIQSLENSNYFAGVGRPSDDLAANYKLLVDIRSFQVSTSPTLAADFELFAKIMDTAGKVVGTRNFRATVPVARIDAALAVAALDEAFRKAVTELVMWTAGVV